MSETYNILAETPNSIYPVGVCITCIPWDVKNLILDLAINVKIKVLEWDNIKFAHKRIDFENLLTLLKKWHNKKAVRSAILELLVQDINHINLENTPELKFFIIDLIKIDELGIAKIFYDLLILHVEMPPELILENNDFIIESCESDEILLERLVKTTNVYLLYEYYTRYLNKEVIILKTVIKFEKIDFLILYDGYINDLITYEDNVLETLLDLLPISEKIINQYTKEYKELVYEKYSKILSFFNM